MSSSFSFIEHFSALKDPREQRKILYPLEEILLLVLSATLGGADTFTDIVLWGRTKLEFLRRFYPFKEGVPSHDTLNDVMNAIDTDLFSELFSAWVLDVSNNIPGLVHIDGKTSRRSRGSGEADKPLHVVSAWASEQRLVLGQEACREKSNEITAIPELLEKLYLKGALITIDAMGCQTKIADLIVEKEANYLLALKDNQRSLAREVERYFNEEKQSITCFETMDADHGRIERRQHFVSHDVDWLLGTKNAPGEPKFRNLAFVGMIENEIINKATGKVSVSRRYYISSLPLDPETFAYAARAHWSVENNLHWIMDVVFQDDLSRLRTENGPKNMNIIKQVSINLVSKNPKKISMKAKRKLCGWDEEFLQNVILQKS